MRVDVPIDRLHANPFRRIEQYPIQDEKVEALVESIEQTGFWNNLVVRKTDPLIGRCEDCGDHENWSEEKQMEFTKYNERTGGHVIERHPGVTCEQCEMGWETKDVAHYEIAYGHHRLEALFRFAEKIDERITVNVEVKDLSDKEMLKIMARENMEEWGSDAWIDLETVRSTVEAYAEGKIDLPQPKPNTKKSLLRYAPSFVQGDVVDEGRQHPYTAQNIGDFLGWVEPRGKPSRRLLQSLTALEYIEKGLLHEDQLRGLSTSDVRALISRVKKRLKQEKKAADNLKKEAEEAEQQAEEATDPQEKQAAENRKQELEQKAQQHEERAKEQAKKQAEQVSEQLQNDEKGANEVLREDSTPEAPEPDKEEPAEKRVRANEILDTITMQVGNTLAEGSKLREKVDELGRLVDEGFLREEQVEEVVSVLRMLSDRADGLADDLEHREVEYEVSLS